ncbi:hypothetical protein EZV73_11335 [Acidaminobacter sp. JC074]|uniref:histidine kinase n=1 Tax=Acidaminobacter sp. JC074 TaxID=2530199 RepID=UPI001F10343E|nr:histidine kinase [Acidaminobacter sp. JC074]MCH4888170.1 hypothetical protein [Acidaminobacter sp. JC074]
MLKKSIIIILTIYIMVMGIYFLTDSNAAEIEIVNGQAHASLKDDKLISLDGQWLFAINRFEKGESDAVYDFIEVPSPWHSHTYLDKPIPRQSYGTYKLDLRLDKTYDILALRMPHLRTNYAVYIDGKRVDSNTPFGFDVEGGQFNYKREIAFFKPESDAFTIYIQILNQEHARGGFTETVILGEPVHVSNHNLLLIVLDAIFIGVMVILLIYHLYIFILNRDDKLYLYTMLLYLLMTVYFVLENENLFLLMVEDVNEILAVKVSYLAAILVPYCLYKIIHTTLDYHNQKLDKILFAIVVVELSLSFMSPFYISTRLLPMYGGSGVMFFIIAIYVSIKGMRDNNKYASQFLMFGILMMLSFVLDLAFDLGNLYIGNTLVAVNTLSFTIFQAFVLAEFNYETRLALNYAKTQELDFYKRITQDLQMPIGSILAELSVLDDSVFTKSQLSVLYYNLGDIISRIGFDEDSLPVKLKGFSVYFLLQSIISELGISENVQMTTEDDLNVLSDPGMLRLVFVNMLLTLLEGAKDKKLYIDFEKEGDKVFVSISSANAAQIIYNSRRDFQQVQVLFNKINIDVSFNRYTIKMSFDAYHEILNEVEDKREGNIPVVVVSKSIDNIQLLQSFIDNKYKISFYQSMSDEKIYMNNQLKIIILDVSTIYGQAVFIIDQVRALYSKLELPIICILDYKDAHVIQQLYKAGANELITKPFTMEMIRNKMDNLLESSVITSELLNTRSQLLEAQIRPHFVNNTLNAIASLIASDPEQAENLTVEFAQYLRYKLKFFRPDNTVSIDEELELVELYCSIEKVRYEKRLEVDIQSDVESFEIQPLMIQPLVENAIKHNLEKHDKVLKVNVRVFKADGYYHIVVKDNGVGFLTDGDYKGVGLKNIEGRLKYYYGEELEVESVLDFGTTVTYKIKEQS